MSESTSKRRSAAAIETQGSLRFQAEGSWFLLVEARFAGSSMHCALMAKPKLERSLAPGDPSPRLTRLRWRCGDASWICGEPDPIIRLVFDVSFAQLTKRISARSKYENDPRHGTVLRWLGGQRRGRSECSPARQTSN